MRKSVCLLAALLLSGASVVLAQDKPVVEEFRFRFVAGRDMLYSPWGGNGESLHRLSGFIREHREAIVSGAVPVHVEGYCASAGSPEVRLRRARQMCNRVKTELILRGGLSEKNFRTRNAAEAYGELRNAVVVRIFIPKDDVDGAKDDVGSAKDDLQEAKSDLDNSNVVHDDANVEHDDANVVHYGDSVALPKSGVEYSRWSLGLNVGIPLFWGDMVSFAADDTYLGFAAGVQGAYRFSPLLGANLSVDYARGKTGTRGYAKDYQLSPDGMTLYEHGTETSRAYGELYSRISVVNVGLGLDVYLNRLFGTHATTARFQAVLAPTVYAQFFHTSLYNKVSDTKFSDGTTKPDALSLGLGGALSLRYRLAPALSVQLKNSLLWMTDNKFDGIVKPYDHSRRNLMWLPQVGVLWEIF